MRALPLLLMAACSAPPLARPAEASDPPGPGEARVVVYRPFDRNPLRTYAVYDGMELAGFVASGSRLDFLCAPGEHLFLLLGSSDATHRAVLEPGRTYVLKAGATPELFRLRLSLEPSSPGDEELEALTPLERVPETSEAFLLEHWDRVAERLKMEEGR